MDAISYSYADKQAKRIKKIINDPDSNSGVVTVPKVIASGESVTIPAGRVAILPDVQVDGTLNVLGDIFIPTGTANSKVVQKVASTDKAIPRFNGTTGDIQNSGVIIDDGNNVVTTGHIKSTYSQITGNGFTGTFAIDSSGIYTDVGSTNYRIYSGGSERMRIDSAGNVGIGTVPSASWVSGASILSVAHNDTSIWGANPKDLRLTSNYYYNSGYKYLTNGTAQSFDIVGNGIFVWFTAPSGTAGSTINWQQTMLLDASGNLNVGYSNSFHSFGKTTGSSAGTNGIFVIANLGSDDVFKVYDATNLGGANTAGSAVRIGRSSTTSRSINAGGTINASGADYAEYEYSNDITLVKGQIVGFKADGTLTDKYSESIRFAIKSTNPSIVGGDTWGIEEIIGKRPEQPVKTEEMTDEDFTKLEEQYKKDLADFEARLEAERQKVDRIAYAGKVPVNVYGAVAGQYVIAIEKEDGAIDGKLVNKADMTFTEYQDAVGRVNKILDDGRAEVAVIIH